MREICIFFFCHKLLTAIWSITLSNLLIALKMVLHLSLSIPYYSKNCQKIFCFFQRYDRNLHLLFLNIINRIVLIGRSRLYDFLVSKSTNSCDIIIKENKFLKWHSNFKFVPCTKQTFNLLTLNRNTFANCLFILNKTTSSEEISDGLCTNIFPCFVYHFHSSAYRHFTWNNHPYKPKLFKQFPSDT